jgi:hypothetical protein
VVPFNTIQEFVASTSNLMREVNTNVYENTIRLDRVEAKQDQIIKLLADLVAQGRQQTSSLEIPIATVTPGPRSLLSDFFVSSSGNYT